MSVEDDNIHRIITFCAGPADLVHAVEANVKKRATISE